MRRLRNDEGGASALFVCICLLVIIGFGALVIDVGALYQERRELQSGADAGALAVAKDCAGAAACPASITTTARSFADANAADGASAVDSICGNVAGVGGCANPPTVPTGTKYVRVTLSTVDGEDGGTQVSFGLARALGFTGDTVHAKAVAAWGALKATTTVPLTFSLCEFNEATNNGTTFASGPPWVGAEKYIYFHGSNQVGTCKAGPSGSDLPGGFGWLDNTGCKTAITAGGTVDADTGNGLPNDCKDTVVEWRDKVLVFPIYSDCSRDKKDTSKCGGTQSNYQIAGFAAIHITGYQFNGNTRWPATFSCPGEPGNSGVCIRGHFTKYVATGDIGGTTNYGVSAVRIVG